MELDLDFVGEYGYLAVNFLAGLIGVSPDKVAWGLTVFCTTVLALTARYTGRGAKHVLLSPYYLYKRATTEVPMSSLGIDFLRVINRSNRTAVHDDRMEFDRITVWLDGRHVFVDNNNVTDMLTYPDLVSLAKRAKDIKESIRRKMVDDAVLNHSVNQDRQAQSRLLT